MAGVLERLRELEGSAGRAAAEQERVEQSHGRLQRLQDTVRQLRAARHRLRSAVNTGAAGDMQELLVRLGSGPCRLPSQDELAAAILREKLAALRGLLHAYRLTGISGELRDAGTMSFCISTGYEGTYLDCYQLDVQLQPPCKLLRHNLPTCIPLQLPAGDPLQPRHLPPFLETVHGTMNAYAGRQYQLQQLQERQASWTSQIQKNAACNLLRFHYPVGSGEMEQDVGVKLVYEDLSSCLPTGVTLTCTGAMEECVQEELKRHRQLFLRHHLHRALDCIKQQAEPQLVCISPGQYEAQ